MWTMPGEYLKVRGADYQVGTVPQDQMIGKAFFVYWPMGYRVEWLPILVYREWSDPEHGKPFLSLRVRVPLASIKHLMSRILVF